MFSHRRGYSSLAMGTQPKQEKGKHMVTIALLARQFGMEPYALQEMADMHDTPQDHELDERQEAFLRDLLTKTGEDGVYRGE